MSVRLYHGSENIIEKPEYGKGARHNDYGKGFYCTEDIELAKEWACAKQKNGYANIYDLDMTGLTIFLTGWQYLQIIGHTGKMAVLQSRQRII